MLPWGLNSVLITDLALVPDVLLAPTAAAVAKRHVRHALLVPISLTAGSRAAACVLQEHRRRAVGPHAHRALPGRSKNLPGSRFVSRVLLAHTAAAVKCLAQHALQARTRAKLDNRVALLALPVHTAAAGS